MFWQVFSRSREPLYYYFQVTIFMGLSYQLLRQQVVKREGKYKLPKWPNLDIWSTRREPNSKWPSTASYSYNGPPFLIISRLTYVIASVILTAETLLTRIKHGVDNITTFCQFFTTPFPMSMIVLNSEPPLKSKKCHHFPNVTAPLIEFANNKNCLL